MHPVLERSAERIVGPQERTAQPTLRQPANRVDRCGRHERWDDECMHHEARDRVAKPIKHSPPMRNYPAEVLSEAYPPARRTAEA